MEAVLVQAADAISGARPGARREALESYVKRLEALEGVARFLGGRGQVLRHSGRPRGAHHRQTRGRGRPGGNAAGPRHRRKIEESLEYPGQIKVTVIRETRAVDYAK